MIEQLICSELDTCFFVTEFRIFFQAYGCIFTLNVFSLCMDSRFINMRLFTWSIVDALVKWQVAIFVVLAMVLRRKPDALLNVLPTLRESSKYKGQDKLPVVAWMIAQVIEWQHKISTLQDQILYVLSTSYLKFS